MSDVMRLSVRVMRVHLTVTLTVASEQARTLQMMNNLLLPATFFCHRKLSETLAHYFGDFLFFEVLQFLLRMNRLPDMCRYKKSLNNFVRFEISLEMAEEKN